MLPLHKYFTFYIQLTIHTPSLYPYFDVNNVVVSMGTPNSFQYVGYGDMQRSY